MFGCESPNNSGAEQPKRVLAALAMVVKAPIIQGLNNLTGSCPSLPCCESPNNSGVEQRTASPG